MKTKLYRQGVCIVVKKPDSSHVLLCHRIGQEKELGWQFPQGGRDYRERIRHAALRELLEEVGTDEVSILRVSPKAYAYDFPEGISLGKKKEFTGQALVWVLVSLNTASSKIHFEHQPAEFDAYRWVEPTVAIQKIVGFKRACYIKGLKALGLH